MIEFWHWKLSGNWFYYNKAIYLNDTRFPGFCLSWKKGQRGIRIALDEAHVWDTRPVPPQVES